MTYRQLVLTSFVSMLFISFSLYAKENVLCTVFDDIDSDVTTFIYEMDKDARVMSHFYIDRMTNGVVSRQEITEDSLKQEGLVLYQSGSHVVARVISENIDRSAGGIITLDVLYNGITGERKNYEIKISLEPQANGNMAPSLYFEGNKINRLKFIANKIRIIGVVGVRSVVPLM